jgi:hypothetical protein
MLEQAGSIHAFALAQAGQLLTFCFTGEPVVLGLLHACIPFEQPIVKEWRLTEGTLSASPHHSAQHL